MNLFFDEESQKLLMLAKKEMFELKHPYVGSEHLLLAILKTDYLDITRSLNSYNITYDNFKDKLIETIGIGSKSNEWFLFTPLLRKILNNASYYSKNNYSSVTPYNLLISILQEGDGVANRILISMNIDLEALYDKFLSSSNYITSSNKKLMLDSIAINMNKLAESSKYDPVIGRDDYINRIIQILLRKNKNNPLLIGEAGVGKTAIIEELARKIVNKDVPIKLQNMIIYNLSMSVLVAGTKYRGEFEEKINKIINEVKDNPNIILFIDELHTLVGAGGAEGAIDASNIIKPFLARGDIKVIGATTVDEYTEFIEHDKALERRFQKIYVSEPNIDEIKNILYGLKNIYEQFHNVLLPNNIIDLIVNLSSKYLLSYRQPDKAIDLLDEVCSYVSINNMVNISYQDYELKIKNIENKKNNEIIKHNFKKALEYKNEELKLKNDYNNALVSKTINRISKVEMGDVYKVFYDKTHIPLNNYLDDKLNICSRELKKYIYGQDKIISDIILKIKSSNYVLGNKPLSFLLVGKSGVGKTFFAEKLAEFLVDKNSFFKINMSEYKDSSSISKIIGSSYGYNNTSYFIKKIKERPFSIILLDNINECCLTVLNLFSSVLDSGILFDSKNNQIDLSKCIIFMTLTDNSNSIGFVNSNSNILSDDIYNKISYIMRFNDITKKDIISYLKDNNLYGKEVDNILEESNYSNYGFSKVSFLCSKYLLDDKVKS